MKNREPLHERPEYVEAMRQREELQRTDSCTNVPHQWYLHDMQFELSNNGDIFEDKLELVGHYYILHCKKCHEMRRFSQAEMKLFSSYFDIDGYKEKKKQEE